MHNTRKAAMRTSTAFSNDSSFISPRIARRLHEHHTCWMARPVAHRQAYQASYDMDVASMLRQDRLEFKRTTPGLLNPRHEHTLVMRDSIVAWKMAVGRMAWQS